MLDLFVSPGGRGYAAVRLTLFLGATAALVIALTIFVSAHFAGTFFGVWALAIPHAVIAVSALAAGLGMAVWFDRAPDAFAALGLPMTRRVPLALLSGAGFGALLIGVLVVAQVGFGWLDVAADAGTAGGWLRHMGTMAGLFAVGAVSEELLFRSYGFRRLVEWLDVRLAVLVDAALFGALHVNNPRADVLPLINIGLAGALLAVVYLRTRSLWVAIGLHWSWNFFTTFFDRPVSGIEFDAPGYDFLESGPDLLTGGAFGPEGGLLVTIITLAAIAWVVRKPFPRVAPGGEESEKT